MSKHFLETCWINVTNQRELAFLLISYARNLITHTLFMPHAHRDGTLYNDSEGLDNSLTGSIAYLGVTRSAADTRTSYS